MPIAYGKTVTEIMSEEGGGRCIFRYVKENKKSREKAKPWHEEAGRREMPKDRKVAILKHDPRFFPSFSMER